MTSIVAERNGGHTESGHHWFATTHWTTVLAARHQASPDATTALEKLCQTYWYPLYACIRRRGHNVHDAQDLTQSRYGREAAAHFSPETLFDPGWAVTILDQALARLREQFAADGRSEEFAFLKVYLEGETKPGEYEAVAKPLQMSVGAIAVAVHRLRQTYRNLVRSEVAQTVSDRRDIEEEMRHLLKVISE